MDNIVVSRDACGERGPYAVAWTTRTATIVTAAPIGARVWRELAGLALEGLAIGVVFSVLMAAAVYLVARNTQDRPELAHTVMTSPATIVS
jgi:hypothetical protein